MADEVKEFVYLYGQGIAKAYARRTANGIQGLGINVSLMDQNHASFQKYLDQEGNWIKLTKKEYLDFLYRRPMDKSEEE